jgi:hypothetical protein
VPVWVTGEPKTGTFAVMASVAGTAPSDVGENTTLIVHEAPAAKVVVQVPPAAGREKTADENDNEIAVAFVVP